MTALTKERNTPEKVGTIRSGDVAAATTCYQGGMGAYDASGNIVPASTATTLKIVGRFVDTYDNAAGSAGDLVAEIKEGVFKWANSAAADEITAADISADCYAVDDQTVAKTNGGSTRSKAGVIIGVDSDGVWVKQGLGV
jgi:hypothetical protein